MSLVTSARWLIPRQCGVVASTVSGMLDISITSHGPGPGPSPGHPRYRPRPQRGSPAADKRRHPGGRSVVTVELSDDNGAYQVADDVELLDLMLDDLAAAAPVFQPP